MKKTHLTITVNEDLPYKLKLKGIYNVSNTVNEMLEFLVQEDSDTHKLREELKILKEKRSKIDLRVIAIQAVLDAEAKKLTEEEKERQEKELKETESVVEGIIKGGLL